MAELLAASLGDADVLCPRVSAHPWAAPGRSRSSLWDGVRRVWEEEFGVSPDSAGGRGAEALLQELRGAESPAPSATIPFRQVRSKDVRGTTCLRLLLGADAVKVLHVWSLCTRELKLDQSPASPTSPLADRLSITVYSEIH